MTIRLILLLILLLLSGTIFSACTPQNSSGTPVQQESSVEKTGFTTLTGTLTMTGSTGQLQTSTGSVAVESLAVDLADYNGQTITVTGQYSGDTLFVSEVTLE